ncbi:MAG: ferrochelatase, partial [Bacteroidota bacterium]
MRVNTDSKIGVMLVNLGTPDSPAVKDVRKYLREFLMDARVVDVPAVLRFILVNGIIAPFRAPKSAKVYQEVWEERGSPLKFYGEDVRDMLQEKLGEEYYVELAMRYQNPSIASVLDKMRKIDLEKIIVIPLFPQYASATTGSVQEKVMEIVRKWQVVPEISFVHNFYDHPIFIKTFSEIGKKYLAERNYDHIIFSYHGLPERQIRRADDYGNCLKAAKA